MVLSVFFLLLVLFPDSFLVIGLFEMFQGCELPRTAILLVESVSHFHVREQRRAQVSAVDHSQPQESLGSAPPQVRGFTHNTSICVQYKFCL